MNKFLACVVAASIQCLSIVLLAPATAAVVEHVPGVRLEIPDDWVTAEALQDGVELAHVNADGGVDARVLIRLERRKDPEDALARAAQITARLIESAEFLVIHGWPAAIQRSAMPLPQRRVGPPPLPAVRYTLVVVVGGELYVGTGWVLSSAGQGAVA